MHVLREVVTEEPVIRADGTRSTMGGLVEGDELKKEEDSIQTEPVFKRKK